ncbi:PAS domain-containing protein [Ramlibacter sp.]|uniref:PAS domain-containing sensor histidine kinase n=1 Tax=Ramlibacter sp. TaxID=1917967 RepID=UPI00182C1FC9|nr:PAS domain-containing protein [Ramlibacter sp.]MBA2673364.1 PAS domain-containing protein [Ramlibacter sp.]
MTTVAPSAVQNAESARTGGVALSAEFESIFAAAPVGLALFDRDGRYRRVNAELARINGLPAEAHAGRLVHEVVPGLGDEVMRVIAQVHATGETLRDIEVSGETPRAPGQLRHWLCGFFPVRGGGGGGGVEAVGAWVTDITERKQAHRALEAGRLKLQMGIEAAGLVMAEIDYRTNQNSVSAELAQLLEIADTAVTVPRQVIFDRIHPDDRERYLRGIAQATDPNGTGHLAIDVRGLLPSGTVRWLHVRLQVIFTVVAGRLQPDLGICAARDVTAEKTAERKLRTAQRLAESVIEGAGALVYAKDLQGRYFLSNQAWRALHGLKPEQAQGITDTELFGADAAAVLRANDLAVTGSGEPLLVQERATVHGQAVTYRSSKFPLYDEAGQIYGVCGMSTDISDVVEADRRKNEFLAMLAHELRNPLAPIRTGLEIIKRCGELPPPAARARGVMERQLTHMVRLIDDLLDVARVSRGRLELRIAPLTLQAVVEHALETSRGLVEVAGHVLEVELPQAPVWLQGDLTRLAQVVGNLISNAAKYTPRGGRIDLRAVAGHDQVVIEVRDNGQGIGADVLPNVFELFAQGHDTIHNAQGGLGIGLWLVKKLVEMHGGAIQAHSGGAGQGSLFVVRLPVVEAAGEPPGA